jgi:hypothetical protein
MVIVGLAGGIGHGKTTFASYLARCARSHRHYESSEIITEVANDLRSQSVASPKPTDTDQINRWLEALPAILEKRTHNRPQFETVKLSSALLADRPDYYEKLFEYLSLMQQKPELQTGKITESNKQTFRNLLQWLGGYLAKTVSGELWFEEIIARTQANKPVELVTIGGVRFPADAAVIKRHGGSIINIVRPIGEADLQDLTERERSLIDQDSTVHNDADLARLKALAIRLYDDLLKGRLKPEYKASEQA